ncbi:archaetidylserine decarboxylase [Ferroacidibacillus organovorans]|uniref:phosphatidylserine decarboxylase n=1 Tax=Ferroacidibacillus organovorans TaxID=1765683 RepID=A0A101XQD0_9BACL|nr:archaetidylserine decarboxylase [Ferroacidibacillus organovorans]KUO95605.1 hypothetical protein ATW55_06935 [Ferroacidibacillus organovorans]
MRRAFLLAFLLALPKRTLSALLGRLMSVSASRRLIPYFIRFYRINVSEIEADPSDYTNLSDFFSRRLALGARSFCGDESTVLSPVDARVASCGKIVNDQAIQVKGKWYSVSELTGMPADRIEGGVYLTLYLSPRDYHRIHAPLPGKILAITHTAGTLYPVNRFGVNSVRKLFLRNERTVTTCQFADFTYYLVSVGAFGVGSIRLTEPFIAPEYPRKHRAKTHTLFCGAHEIERGQEIGYFSLGSTVVLVFEKDQFEETVVQGDVVKAGEPIGRFLALTSLSLS